MVIYTLKSILTYDVESQTQPREANLSDVFTLKGSRWTGEIQYFSIEQKEERRKGGLGRLYKEDGIPAFLFLFGIGEATI